MASFIAGLGIFPSVSGIGTEVETEGDALTVLTGLDDPNMNSIWLGVTGLTFLGAVGLAFITKTITPIGIHVFSLVFWTSWIRMSSVLSYGGFIPVDLLLVATVAVMFVFIAAIVGMLTGSG